MAFRCFSSAQAAARPRVLGMCFLLTQLSLAVHIRDGEKDVQMVIDGAGDTHIDGVYNPGADAPGEEHAVVEEEPAPEMPADSVDPNTMEQEENAPEMPMESEITPRSPVEATPPLHEPSGSSAPVPVQELHGNVVLEDRLVFRQGGRPVSFESFDEMTVLFCDTPIQLDLRNTRARYSNLGKHGPSDGLSAEGVLLPNVFPGGARKLDLVIEAIGPYYPANVSKNGMIGHFVNINVESGSFVELRISIVDQMTNMGPPDLPPWMVTLVDIDEQRPEHGGTEYMAVSGYEYFVVTNDSEIEIGQDELSRSTFLSTKYGTPEDNPVHNSRQMTDAQLRRSVSFIFNGSTTSFFMRFHTYEGWSGRNLLFTGVSNMICPRLPNCTSMDCPADYVTKEGGENLECKGAECIEEVDLLTCCEPVPEPERAYCTELVCPPGYAQVPDAPLLFCAFDHCTSGDAELCCEVKHVEACSNKGFLSFLPGSLMYSNLGGSGPEFLAPPGIHLRDVFPYRHDVVDLIITNVTEYRTIPSDALASGLVDDMLYVNVATGTNVTLNVKFVHRGARVKGGGPHAFTDVGSGHSNLTHSFYFTFSKIDGNVTTGIKRVTTFPVSHYNLSNATYLVTKEISPSQMQFTADGGHQVNSPTNLAKDFAFNRDFENAVVGVYYEGVTAINLTLSVAGGTPNEKRTFLIGGLDTPIECKGKARCDTMSCSAGYTRVEEAHLVECAGEICGQDDVAMCCFPLEEDFCRTRFGLYLNQVYTNVSSNLGGLGPDRRAFPGLIVRDIFPNFEEVINLEITNTTPYQVAKGGMRRNTVFGETLNIHVQKGTSVGLMFRLLSGKTNQPIENMFAYLVSFLDLLGDTTGFGSGVTMRNFTEYYVAMNTLLHVNAHSFRAGDWNPENAEASEAGLAVDSEQLQDIVSFKQGPNASSFHVTLDASSEGEVPPSLEDIVFKILGATRVNCPARESCATFSCPEGYASKKLDYPTYCQGERCTTDDVQTCCIMEQCMDSRMLQFKRANQRWNNLGGHGPQYIKPHSIMIDKVFPYDQTISCNISVDGLYFSSNTSLNGVDHMDVANINLHTGTDSRLRFSFINATTNESVLSPAFLFSVGDIDEQRDHGGHESAEIWPIPTELFVPRGLGFDVQYPNRFNSRIFGDSVDNMNGSWSDETAAQENHSVSMMMPRVKEFFLDVHVTPGWAGRNVAFGGADKLACPPPGPPTWMKSGGRIPVPFEDSSGNIDAEGVEASSEKYDPREIDPVPTDPFEGH